MEMEEVFWVTPADLDLMGTVMVTQMLDRMQRLADTHANALGVGREALRTKNLVWMSARSTIAMERELRLGERIRLHTWTGENTRAACPRYFAFYDKEGMCFGGGATLWMLIDPDMRRIVSPQKAGILQDQATLYAPPVALPQQLARVSHTDVAEIRNPFYSDLDINGHVNNVRYVNWVLDALPLQRLQTHFVEKLQINYHQEIRPDDICEMSLQNEGDKTFVCGKSQHDGKMLFEAELLFKPRAAG